MKYFVFWFIFFVSQQLFSQNHIWKKKDGNMVSIDVGISQKGKWIEPFNRPKTEREKNVVSAKKEEKIPSTAEVIVSATRIYEEIDQQPAFPGGLSKLLIWLNKNLVYPVSAQREGIQGRVIAQFIIDKDGSICDVKIIQSVRKDLDMEVIRVISSMPKWTPGYIKNQPVRVRLTLPVTFKLNDK